MQTRHDRLLHLERTTREQSLELNEDQIRLFERFSPEFRERHIETRYTGDLVVVDTFFVGTYVLNEYVLPFFEKHKASIMTVLSDIGGEYYGRADRHPYELFLQLEGIEHRTTKVRRPQSNGYVERLHRTLLDEHFWIEGRITLYRIGRADAEGPRHLPASLQPRAHPSVSQHEWPNTVSGLYRRVVKKRKRIKKLLRKLRNSSPRQRRMCQVKTISVLVGHYRVVYEVNDQEITILVLRIDHRKNAYL